MTKAHFNSVVYLAFLRGKSDVKEDYSGFEDLKESYWYQEAILTLED